MRAACLTICAFALALAATLASGPTADAATCAYVVKAGDTLASIARSQAPAGATWQDLYASNQSALGANPG